MEEGSCWTALMWEMGHRLFCYRRGVRQDCFAVEKGSCWTALVWEMGHVGLFCCGKGVR